VRLEENYIIDHGKMKKKYFVFLFEPIDCTLEEIIKIRKEHSDKWKVEEMESLMHSLSTGLFELSQMNICHRNIQPRTI